MSVLHGNDAVRQNGFFHLVRNIDNGNAFVLIKMKYRIDNILASFRIEHGCWLVKDNAFGFKSDNAGNRDALLLSARQAMRCVLSVRKHAHISKSLFHSRPDFWSRHSNVFKAKGHIFFDDSCNNLVIWILENHSYGLTYLPKVFLNRRIKAAYLTGSLRRRQTGIEMTSQR